MQIYPIQQTFQVTYHYTVHFTENLFSIRNSLLRDVIASGGEGTRKVFFVVDHHVAEALPALTADIKNIPRIMPILYNLPLIL
ncbi:hypothetical protein AHMF7616_03849 [Adhaeribacter pallidiroseus]|uniref:3-dehydroquinate synthase n=1 Tax=Adhaeribacter pallidiroseus TaxID=2072847 RepID=A0A369QQV5_9BACT|nr:hypothetical protein AHMF7616_03849 [Adhaeribacter pallidiroseus]